MREIEFRYFNKKENRFYYFRNGKYFNDLGVLISERICYEFLWNDKETPPEEYTGLKDKNGVKIFEGDIVKSFVHPKVPLYHIIEWSEKYNSWFAHNIRNKEDREKTGSIMLYIFANNTEFETMCNIHKNKDLIDK